MTIQRPEPTGPSGVLASRIFVWMGIAFGVVAIVAFVVMVVALAQGSDGLGAVAGFIVLLLAWALLFYPVLLSIFRLSAHRRARLTAALYPGAYLLEFVARPTSRGQLTTAAYALGVRASGVPWNNYAILVADNTAIRIVSGFWTPTERVALPTAALVSATYQPRPIGIRTLGVLVLAFQRSDGQVAVVELLPVRWTSILMRTLPPEYFPLELAAMQKSTHPQL
ncbi:hypothetical protein BH11ACT3_BH11ACT3_20060 [soil metagenome]